jgi:hypothetical protein
VNSVIVVLGLLLQHWVLTAASREEQDRAHLGGDEINAFLLINMQDLGT